MVPEAADPCAVGFLALQRMPAESPVAVGRLDAIRTPASPFGNDNSLPLRDAAQHFFANRNVLVDQP